MSSTVDNPSEARGASSGHASAGHASAADGLLTDPRVAGLAELVSAGSGGREPIPIENPATGKPFAEVPRCTTEDVATAVARARNVQRTWRKKSFKERERILLRFHDLVLDNREQ